MVVGSSKVSCVESGQPGTKYRVLRKIMMMIMMMISHALLIVLCNTRHPSIHPSQWDTSQPGFILSGLGCGGGLIKEHE
jgi:hypothetical protein